MEQRKGKKSAKDRLLGHLGRRDHSELELRRKLSQYHDEREINQVLEWCHGNELLPSPEDLAEKFRRYLDEKNKSHLYIVHYLRSKGLPPVEKDPEMEFQKAKKVLEKREYSSREKAVTALRRYGFDGETIRKAIYEVL